MAKTVRPRATSARKRKPSTAQSDAEKDVLSPQQETAISSEESLPAQNEAPHEDGSAKADEDTRSTSSPYPVQALYFDATWYLATYPDVGACGIDAVEHFMTHGYLEGRDPNGAFSVSEYIAANPDIPLTINPFLHFIMHGAAEGRPLRR